MFIRDYCPVAIGIRSPGHRSLRMINVKNDWLPPTRLPERRTHCNLPLLSIVPLGVKGDGNSRGV